LGSNSFIAKDRKYLLYNFLGFADKEKFNLESLKKDWLHWIKLENFYLYNLFKSVKNFCEKYVLKN